MKTKNHVAMPVVALLTVALAVLGGMSYRMYGKVKKFNETFGVDVLAFDGGPETFGMDVLAFDGGPETFGVDVLAFDGGPSVPYPEKPASAGVEPGTKEVKKAASGELRVDGNTHCNDNCISMYFSAPPDLEAIRRYVTVDPAPERGLVFNCMECWGRYRLEISGDFAFDTNSVLRVAKGLPSGRPKSVKPLGADYVYRFRRANLKPHVKFSDRGRYLPPCGDRTVEVESVNADKVDVVVSRIEPANLVQLLAREERIYLDYYGDGMDSENSIEIFGLGETNSVKCVNRKNVKEKNRVKVAMKDGKPENGIFLVHAKVPRPDEDDFRNEHSSLRVVCVSDIGLSVRHFADGKMGVWVTSLTTGKPVAGTRIEVYTSFNTKIMEGVSDGKGWCEPVRTGKGDAFAVVACAPNGADMSFLALRNSMKVDETYEDGARKGYLEPNEVDAFVWTERGIYRHGEKIFLQAIFRDGTMKAPKPFPVLLQAVGPNGETFEYSGGMFGKTKEVLSSGAGGAIAIEDISIPDDQPSGTWTFRFLIPGTSKVCGETSVRIEEFAPPQIAVKVEDAGLGDFPDFSFSVSAEHLFGGVAKHHRSEGAIVFEDAPFAPDGWKDWSFGNSFRGLEPSFRRLDGDQLLDEEGHAVFSAPMEESSGRPKAAVRVTMQGTVFEDGGRPVSARKSVIKHYYPYYIGSTLSANAWKSENGNVEIPLVCVDPEGKRHPGTRELSVSLDSVESFYSYAPDARGWATWHCERVRIPVTNFTVSVSADGSVSCVLPGLKSGDYAIVVEDAATGVSFGRGFYLGGNGDGTVRAPVSSPSAVSVVPDKPFYRTGEIPRLAVRSPFAGEALLSVIGKNGARNKVFSLTNATSEIVLEALADGDAPNLDVFVSVVQGVENGTGRLAVRAQGHATVCVRPAKMEIDVAVDGKVETGGEGFSLKVGFDAPGAEMASVTVVDEGINILTGEETPDPIGYFSSSRASGSSLFDLYSRVLPVKGGDALKANGVKTGGGFGAEMLMRVSPVQTRRFKPLSIWKANVPVVNGKGSACFKLPEFAGEVRVTVVAWNGEATGADSTKLKVVPKLVIRPDAPRFAAPGDKFDISMPVYNRSGADGLFGYSVSCNGEKIASAEKLFLAKDASTNIVLRVEALKESGEMKFGYAAEGFGEKHFSEIDLPVRPAVAWRETSGIVRIAAGEKFDPGKGRVTWREYDTPLGEYSRAIEWLCDYPYGCLEQTVSRIFPIISSGGILSGVEISPKVDRNDVLKAGVRRVESMVRANDFVMWPDTTYAPWDKEVSLYAAHFLVEAERAGIAVDSGKMARVVNMLSKMAYSPDLDCSVYALHTLALAKRANRDRMHFVYDIFEEKTNTLSLVSRARLARAFAATGDRKKAKRILSAAAAPSSVKEAAFAMIALLELDPDDSRIYPLLKYIHDERDRSRLSWGTTEENAHALLAIGEYFRFHPVSKGDRFVAWRKLELPDISDVKAEANGIAVTRCLLSGDGDEIDPNAVKRGDMVVSEIKLEALADITIGDLVVEDLFAGAFEPVSDVPYEVICDWVMRSDVRDDRMLVFSKRFTLKKGESVVFRHFLRAVSPGEYVLPGVSVEAMYFPSVNSRSAPSAIKVGR